MGSFNIYAYEPNKGAPIVFAVLFAISTVVHVYQTIRYKCWKLTGALSWGGILFVAGFIMREVSAYNNTNLGNFIASLVLLLLAPPVFSLTNYLILSRVLYYVPYLSPIHPGRVLTTFLGIDLIVGILTGNGGAKARDYTNPSSERAGAWLLRASIALQVISYLLFFALEITFHRRCIRAGVVSPKLRTMLYLLYVSSALIMSRDVYRLVESCLGYNSYVTRHEAFFYVFDGSIMFLNSVLLNAFHPRRFLPGSNKIYLAKDGVTEKEGPGYVDRRNFFLTLVDPFDLIGIVLRRDKDHMFWDDDVNPAQPATSTGEAPLQEKRVLSSTG